MSNETARGAGRGLVWKSIGPATWHSVRALTAGYLAGPTADLAWSYVLATRAVFLRFLIVQTDAGQ